MNDTIKLYKEIFKISQMGMGSTATVLSVYEGSNLSKEIAEQNDEYRKIFVDSKKEIDASCMCNCKKGLSAREKIMSSCMIKMKMMKDKSDSSIAEMIIKGCNMGIVDAIKAKNAYKNADDKSITMAQKLIDFQNGTVERMKAFL